MPTYSDKEFVTHFRIGRSMMATLVQQFAESPVYQALVALGEYLPLILESVSFEQV